MANTFQLKLLTPYKSLFEGPVEAVMLPGAEGEFGVLTSHTKFASELQPGVVRFTVEGQTKVYGIGGGFAEVTDDMVIVLADSAERPEEIDRERAEDSLTRTQANLEAVDSADEARKARLQAKLARAMNRIKVAKIS